MIADRFLLQQAWWILSELCRRHERTVMDRFVHEQHGGVLLAKRIGKAAEPETNVGVAANLVDGIRIMQRSGSTLIPWAEVFEAGDAHAIVRHIERISPLGPVESAPSTTHRTLVYRLAARILASRLDDRHDWSIEPLDAAAAIQGERTIASLGEAVTLPTVRADLEHQRQSFATTTAFASDHPVFVPHLWVVRRDVDVAMVLDTDGFVHTRSRGLVPVERIYEEHGRDLDRVLHAVWEATRE
ncbi:TY-Chap2 family putative peptide chaperone [Agrococcus sp. SGAir0287]|uniref:TY-Chap2 family putative peptide chaperone n=1 Tax=Agrococcus sp. SGAir0287 TaxID=2070347 RepID=UPI0010CD5C86|nr:hypothetical protein [Agrococcus sp. SGAir0287]QCR20287.1 hypothetical protein C1N71_13270 [Agrococcus sp. SGAir0287]